MESSKRRNPSIDVFRYYCAILVIAMHTRPFEEVNASLGYIVTEVIPRISVPFFFIVSGYYYIHRLQNGEKPFKHYIKRFIIIYLLWSCPFFLIEFIQWGYSDIKGFIVNCIITFIYYGASYHFWYFPALLFALCFFTFLWKLGGRRIIILLSIALYIVGVLGCAYYNVFKNVEVLGPIIKHSQFHYIRRILLMGFPFFASGYLVLKIKDSFSNWHGLSWWFTSLITWVLEILIVVKAQFQRSIVLTFGLYPLVIFTLLVLLKNPLKVPQGIAYTSKKLADFTYFSHPIFVSLLQFVWGKVQFSRHTIIPNTALFFLTVVIAFIMGLLICRFDNSVINKIIS